MKQEIKSPTVQFAEMANPHAWLMTADLLHAQAIALKTMRKSSPIYRLLTPGRLTPLREINGVDKSVFLLGGFALENALKAFLIFENPGWVANGKLNKSLLTHKLSKLCEISKRVPYRKRYAWVLKAFEEGLDSWARYPCHTSIAQTTKEAPMNDQLWAGYLKVTRAYGKRLSELLATGWNNPVSERETWIVEANFLTMLS